MRVSLRPSLRLSLRPSLPLAFWNEAIGTFRYNSPNPVIKIEDGSFYRQYPNTKGPTTSHRTNPPLFSHLTFSLPSQPIRSSVKDALRHESVQQHWAVIGDAGKTDFLNVLRGRYISIPPTARSYPYLSSEEIRQKDHRLVLPSRAIQYVGFGGEKRAPFGGLQGAHLSARYESRKEETDWTLQQYLRGETELNPAENVKEKAFSWTKRLERVMQRLDLEKLGSMPVSSLSNGQTRRARIAKALLNDPEVLLLDEPFMGLDPPTLVKLSTLLRELAFNSDPRLMLSLRPQDPIPDWITHLIVLGSGNQVVCQGPVYSVIFALRLWAKPVDNPKAKLRARKLISKFGKPEQAWLGNVLTERGIIQDEFFHLGVSILSTQNHQKISSFFLEEVQKSYGKHSSQFNISSNSILEVIQDGFECTPEDAFELGLSLPPTKRLFQEMKNNPHRVQVKNNSTTEQPLKTPPLIELENVVVKYGAKVVLGGSTNGAHNRQGFSFTVKSGTRLAVVGPNGSGKTTLLSLLTSDHPQSYALPIKYFGRSRLASPGNPGISLFDIQSQIGHSSPEIHAVFPRHLTMRQTIESAFSETFLGRPTLTDGASHDINIILSCFAHWLNPHYQDEQDCIGPTSLSWATSRANVFGNMSFHQQRLLLFLRAIVKKPKIVILDEAFSGFGPHLRKRAMNFLQYGEAINALTRRRLNVGEYKEYDRMPSDKSPNGRSSEAHTSELKNENLPQENSAAKTDVRFTGLTKDQALIVVSHVKEEIPRCVTEWLRLPGEEEIEAGKGVERGICKPDQLGTLGLWNAIWNSQPNGMLYM